MPERPELTEDERAGAVTLTAPVLEAELADDEDDTAACRAPSSELPPPPQPLIIKEPIATATPYLARMKLNRIERSRKRGESGVSTFSVGPDGSRRIASVFGFKTDSIKFEGPPNAA